MNPSIEQVNSSVDELKRNFDADVKSLERYAAKPDAKQSYIDERNKELIRKAAAIKNLEAYIEKSQMLYPYAAKLGRAISHDPELKMVCIHIKLRDGNSQGKIALID